MMQHFDERSWCRDYEQIKQNVLAKRARGTLCQPEDVRELGVLVAVLEKGLASMQAAPMSFEVTQSELSRRALITENLKKQLGQLNVAGAAMAAGGGMGGGMNGGMGGMNGGVGGMGSGGSGAASNGRHSDAIPSPSPPGPAPCVSAATLNPLALNAVSDRGLAQRQEAVMRQQDLVIADIALGVDRLHQKALEIGEEAKIHNKIIANLDGHVDTATAGLRQEARHIERVRLNSRMCCLYLCVLAELIIIAVLLFIVFQYLHGFPTP